MNKFTARILIVEDDPQIRNFISYVLSAEGFASDNAATAQSAMTLLAANVYDLMLLDLGLPDYDGMDVIRKVREWSEIPILVVSARDQDQEKAQALDAGADDYLTKPFAMGELLARIRAMTRRRTDFSPNVLSCGSLTLDKATFVAAGPMSSLRLGNKEFQMLEMLMRHPGRLVSTEQFMERIWGYDSDAQNNVVWVYLSSLRKKLASIGASVQIKAVRGAGYLLEEHND